MEEIYKIIKKIKFVLKIDFLKLFIEKNVFFRGGKIIWELKI